MLFVEFKAAFQANFASVISKSKLFLTDVSKDELWNAYISPFPTDINQEFNCNSCESFIKNYGNLVAIVDNKLVTIWDFEVEDPIYNVVLSSLKTLVMNSKIRDIFVTKFSKLGADSNVQLLEDKSTIRWQHLYYNLPKSLVTKSADSEEAIMGSARDSKNVFKRSLDELTLDAVQTVLDLISQNSLYRGEESQGLLQVFLKCKQEYAILNESEKDNYCWINSDNNAISRIRNSAIGTLLININDLDLDVAVTKFELLMAPTNYKRPIAIISKRMIEDAEKKIVELGLTESLGRRFAVKDDISVNNVLFVDRSKKDSGIFSQLKNDVVINPKSLSKVEEITLDNFIKNVIPKCNNIEILLENKHQSNMMSLIAAENPASPSLFKWNNRFSWSYINSLADSMKEYVKAAGGKIDGILRFSIQWNDSGNNNIDFDAHVIEPDSNHIYCVNKRTIHPSSGMLDVDIINPNGKVAVENITWTNLAKMQKGTYKFMVSNFASRISNGGFSAEIEYGGEIHSFKYSNDLRGKEFITVAEVEFNKTTGIKFIKSLDSTTASSKDIWNIKTNKFHKVNMVLNSPNHWDNTIGNKHLFFIIDSVKNPSARGIFNEFLKEDLLQHKKVFEALGNKSKVEYTDDQLSGVGFSTTVRNSFIVKVTGSFTRTLKVIV